MNQNPSHLINRFLVILLFSPVSASSSLTIFSMNLHGYHPMGATTRYLEGKNQTLEQADSKLFYFKPDELFQGNATRINSLSNELESLNADILFFQEVGAGYPSSQKDCAEFNRTSSIRSEALNTVFRINLKLNSKYQVRLACRGNLGWWTTPETFKDQRVVTFDSLGKKTIVHDFDSNPYPDGLIVEGLGALISPDIKILESDALWIESETKQSGKLFFQYLVIHHQGTVRLLINIHGNWKAAHFDQAIALRKWIDLKESYLMNTFKNFTTSSTLIAGDFNAAVTPLSQPEQPVHGEVALYPFLLAGPFDYGKFLNLFLDWTKKRPDSKIYSEGLIKASTQWLLSNPPLYYDALSIATTDPRRCLGICWIFNRIDLILTQEPGRLIDGKIFEPQANWVDTNTHSDHPGVVAKFAELAKINGTNISLLK